MAVLNLAQNISCIKLERHSTGVTSFQPSSSSSFFSKIRPNLRSLVNHCRKLNRSISLFPFYWYKEKRERERWGDNICVLVSLFFIHCMKLNRSISLFPFYSVSFISRESTKSRLSGTWWSEVFKKQRVSPLSNIATKSTTTTTRTTTTKRHQIRQKHLPPKTWKRYSKIVSYGLIFTKEKMK